MRFQPGDSSAIASLGGWFDLPWLLAPKKCLLKMKRSIYQFLFEAFLRLRTKKNHQKSPFKAKIPG